jgi:small-conductance mechanosensitive channel
MDALTHIWDDFIFFEGPTHILLGFGYVVGAFVIARLLRFAVRRLARKRAADAPMGAWLRLWLACERPIEHVILLAGVWAFAERLPLVDRAHAVVNGILYVGIVLGVTRGGAAIVRALVEGYAARVTARHGEAIDVGVFALIRKTGVVVVWLLGLMTALHHFRIDIVSIAAALGVGSLAVGLAARETLGNMISGFTLLLDRPFREGDRVRLATTEVGDVREIGLRSTRIQLLDASYLIVPNNELVNSRVVNLSWPSPRVQTKVVVTIVYGSDVAGAKSALVDLARAHAEVLVDPPPSADVVALADSGTTLELGAWLKDARRLAPVGEALRAAAFDALRAKGIEVAVPTRRIHVREESRALA